MTKNTTCKAESLVITTNTSFSYIQCYHSLCPWRIHKTSVNATGNYHESSIILECKCRIWQQNIPLQSSCRSKIWKGNRLEGILIGLFMQQFWMFMLQWTWTFHNFMFCSIPFSFVNEVWLKNILVSGDGTGQFNIFFFDSYLLSGKRVVCLSRQPALQGLPYWYYQTLI